jgi:type IV pilus assembly protein PilY1
MEHAMTISTNATRTRARTLLARMQSFCAALLATLLALPASAAIDIPNDPLTTGARVPPNILFILDDSGSMSFTEMYNPEVSSVSGNSSIRGNSYATNTIYYNPSIDYQAWMTASGTRMTGGTTYGSVYADFNNVGGNTINLASTASCRSHDKNGTSTQVCGGVQTFYVPIDRNNRSASYLSNGDNYYRYQILTDGRIIRSQRLPRQGSSPNYNNGPELNSGCTNTNNTTTWRNCTRVTPTGRTEVAERNNYATWFSYHRTRMKAAKAGASEAFSEIGSEVRVGFRTIWGRNGSQTNANWPRQDVPIPVQYNNGLFDDVVINGVNYDNRTKWYSRMQGVTGSSSTPLHGALNQAGKYFSSSSSAGPYGPQEAAGQLACRQNFTILTTDGYWNNTDNGYPSADRVGNADGTAGTTITEPTTGASYTYTPGTPYRDDHGGRVGTLADVAMHYWKTDLRGDLRNVVPTTTANPAFWQHMVTFGLSIGLTGNTGFTGVDDVPRFYNSWPDPNDSEDADRIDDLLHAAVNSRGTFVAASDPAEFTRGLKDALAAIVERTGSFSNVAANSTSLDAGTRVFQANYVSGVWAGELVAYPVNGTTVSQTPSWRASQGIPLISAGQVRKVFTSNGSTGLAFPDDATDEQLAALARPAGPIAQPYPVTGTNNAAYIAGNRTLEMNNGGTLRNRNHLLGDIVGSSPAYSRDTDTVYVGANDGMLHAFNASTGRELFAYIPNIIDWRHLNTYSRPDYLHRYFVDGPIMVSSRQQTPGKNILVGSLGRGGKGLFALDVTTPGEFSAANFLWERADTPNGNMGMVLGRPIIAKLNDGTTGLIVSNGINSTSERAVLLVYNLENGALIREISTGIGDAANPNGLSQAAGWDQDGNGTLDYVYAGDMLGNVWKFDLSGATTASWAVANSGSPLFTAMYGNVRQPITGGLAIAMHPSTYQTWLFFGTGRFMTTSDVSDRGVQSMYGIVDEGTTVARSDLTSRAIAVVGTGGNPVREVRGFEARAPLPAGSKGWYINLVPPGNAASPEGERIVSDAQIVGDVLVTSSIVPTNDACQTDGKGYLNALDAFSGTSTGPSFFDLDRDGDFTDDTVEGLPIGSIDPGIGMPTLGQLLRGLLVVGGSSGGMDDEVIRETRNVGRVSWREIIRN